MISPDRKIVSSIPNQTLLYRKSTSPLSGIELVWASVVEAAGSTFLVWLLGNVALMIAGIFAGGMIPSPPPFHSPDAESQPVHWWFGRHLPHTWKAPAFAVLFALFFSHSLWVAARDHNGAIASRRLERIVKKLREDWFGLIVRNAVGAWVAALIVYVITSFSPAQMLWGWIREFLFSVTHDLGISVFGRGGFTGLEEWLRWYGANQMKLNFWLLYMAGISDDLGLPNIKALARRLWRNWKQKQSAKTV